MTAQKQGLMQISIGSCIFISVWLHHTTFWVVFSVLASSRVNKVQGFQKWFKWFHSESKWAPSPSMEININSYLMPFDWVQTLTSVIRYIRCTSTVIAIGEQVLLQFTCVISNNGRKIDVSEQDWFQLHHVTSHKSLFVGQSKEELLSFHGFVFL